MTSIINQYRTITAPLLKKELGLPNIMSVPKITKVVINAGVGRMTKDERFLERVQRDLAILSGQKAVFRKAKKSISSFKLREGSEIGIMVTLRGQRMYDFIDRFINIALPRSKDFRGIDSKNFDSQGNLNIGVREHSIFPEIQYESIKDIFSLEITFVTTGKNREASIALFRHLGFPIQKTKK